jgi:hypothetical protein
VAARPKAWVCGRSLVGVRVRIPPGEWRPLFCVCYVCFQVEVSAMGQSLVQRIPTECGMSEFDPETARMRGRLGPTMDVEP